MHIFFSTDVALFKLQGDGIMKLTELVVFVILLELYALCVRL